MGSEMCIRDRSTAGHFPNPEGRPVDHNLPNSNRRHWGDFGNLLANEIGEATYNRVDRLITIPGIVGRGMIVHALEDQGFEEQPSGAAGSRQSHCVIGFANPALSQSTAFVDA